MKSRAIRIIHPPGLKLGFHTRVYLDGVDVSSNVTEVEITIRPGSLPEVKLTVIDVEMVLNSYDPEIIQWESEGGYVED